VKDADYVCAILFPHQLPCGSAFSVLGKCCEPNNPAFYVRSYYMGRDKLRARNGHKLTTLSDDQ